MISTTVRTTNPNTMVKPNRARKERVLSFEEQICGMMSDIERWARKYYPEAADAEDHAQDCLEIALQNKSKFRPGTNIRAWMYTLVKNAFINKFRRAKHMRMSFYEIPEDIELVHNDAGRLLAAEEIRRVLDKMPPKEREILDLYAQGYKYDEIAEVLNIPPGTVRSRMHFSRRMARQVLSLEIHGSNNMD